MMIRLLELRPYIQVATRALFVDSRSLTGDQVMSAIRMNFMTGRARDLVLHVTALQASDVRGLVEVATEADLVGGDGSEVSRIPDIRRGSRFYMFLSGTVA
jgi:hypothetical protein